MVLRAEVWGMPKHPKQCEICISGTNCTPALVNSAPRTVIDEQDIAKGLFARVCRAAARSAFGNKIHLASSRGICSVSNGAKLPLVGGSKSVRIAAAASSRQIGSGQ